MAVILTMHLIHPSWAPGLNQMKLVLAHNTNTFDTVEHNILLPKLRAAGVEPGVVT